MTKLQGPKRSRASSVSSPCEIAFKELPPLGSDAYLEHIRTAATATLPPEALARAFRQLPPGCEASKATLERLLLRRPNKLWDYLGPMVAYARRRGSSNDYEDLLQDGLKRILEILPTHRGKFAERAWHSFCRREVSEAWREKYGRRGERLPHEDSIDEGIDQEDGERLAPGLKSRLPHTNFRPSQVARIEEMALGVLAELPNDFVRTVASRAWFETKRPKHSGQGTLAVDTVPLTVLFPGKSRFQIMRAERYADAQLAATLLAEPLLELDRDWEPVLEALKANAPRPPRGTKEKTQ